MAPTATACLRVPMLGVPYPATMSATSERCAGRISRASRLSPSRQISAICAHLAAIPSATDPFLHAKQQHPQTRSSCTRGDPPGYARTGVTRIFMCGHASSSPYPACTCPETRPSCTYRSSYRCVYHCRMARPAVWRCLPHGAACRMALPAAEPISLSDHPWQYDNKKMPTP